MNDYIMWEKIYTKYYNNLFLFLIGYKFLDNYFLTNSNQNDVSWENSYSGGFIEKDFNCIFVNQSPKDVEKSGFKILFLIKKNLDLSLIRKRLGEESFKKILSFILINGEYENLGLKYENVIALCVKKKYLDSDDFLEMSLKRGMVIGKRKQTLYNKVKSKLMLYLFDL